MSTKRPYRRHVFDANIIREVIKTVESWRALAIKLGMTYPSTTVYTHLRPFCKNNKIDFSHFMGQAVNKGKQFPNKRVEIESYLNNERLINTHALKGKLLECGLKKHRCEKCMNAEWLGEPIPITLHHIDGNSANNNLDNLQILCPNCHAKTDNYCGKNQNRTKEYIVTPDIDFLTQIPLWENTAQLLRSLGLSLAQAHYNRINKLMILNPEVKFKEKELKLVPEDCYRTTSGQLKKRGDPLWRTKPKPHQHKVKHPSKEELEKMIWEKSILQISKDYGITDNSIRAWCRRYGISNMPPIQYWPRRRAGWSHEEAIEPIEPKQVQKRLTDQQVKDILILLKEGKLSQRKIGNMYGINHPSISRINAGLAYKHILRV